MTEDTLDQSPQPADMVDLIKLVRSLDQSGPGEKGENLQLLWRSLTLSAEDKFHAAEESSLRWILKTMNGNTPSAETLRRYPLTWAIVGCVFQRIPLFSLAKSLADRRFTAVLQQTLADVSKPVSNAASSSSSKRKRDSAPLYELETLKTAHSCLATSQAIFHALKCLLDRLDAAGALSSHDKIGAEHVRSLFGSPGAEAMPAVRCLLAMCRLFLNADHREDVEGWESWVETISTIWDLRLQGSDDTLIAATHFFIPCAGLLSRLESVFVKYCPENEPVRSRWSPTIQRFMHKSLIVPARAAFSTQQDISPIETVLTVSQPVIDVAAPVAYFLAVGASNDASRRDVRRSNAVWMERIFQLIEKNVRARPDRNVLIRGILQQAVDHSTSINIGDLRQVAREYGLQEDNTDWSILALVGKCDPVIFYASEEGNELLEAICSRSLTSAKGDSDFESISAVAEAIVKAFCTGRDLPGFLKLWFRQMSRVGAADSTSSVWLELGHRQIQPDALDVLVEKHLSPKQLLDVIKWVSSQEADGQTICLFADTVARGVRSEAFVDAAGRKLFDLVYGVSKSSKSAAGLRWRVISTTISWADPSARAELWQMIKDDLAKILKQKSIDSATTFEAFKCSCQAWVSMTPDDDHLEEVASLADQFMARLADELLRLQGLVSENNESLASFAVLDETSKFRKKTAHWAYLAWYLQGSSRIARLHSQRIGGAPLDAVHKALRLHKRGPGYWPIWTALICNDINLNDAKLATQLIDNLIEVPTDLGQHITDQDNMSYIQLLSKVPLEAFSRSQRERVMTKLKQGRSMMIKRSKHSSQNAAWLSTLSLETRMMSRPTFHEKLAFSNLVETADELPTSLDQSTSSEVLLELLESFLALASATVRQMTENVDERSLKYFQESSDFASSLAARVTAKHHDRNNFSPLYLTLLKALANELRRSTNARSQPELSKLLGDVENVLRRSLVFVIENSMLNKTPFGQDDLIVNMSLFAVVDASSSVGKDLDLPGNKESVLKKLDKESLKAMKAGDLKGWKVQTFLRTHFSSTLKPAPPKKIETLDSIPAELRQSLLDEYIASVTQSMDSAAQMEYLKDLIQKFRRGHDTDGQALAIQHIVNQLIELSDTPAKDDSYDLAKAHYDLTHATSSGSEPSSFTRVCRVLYTILEKQPQAISQWNIEIALAAVSKLSSPHDTRKQTPSFVWRCKLVEVIIKKHRLRLEGHFHLLMAAMQALLNNLIDEMSGSQKDNRAYLESKAHAYARLITLICEPTTGAVARSQQHGSLDSAADAAKRAAGRHMYLLLMQYVKLQLESNVPIVVATALEPAMNSVFDVTPPEGRKILNDAMDASGRAILREMFQRYNKFGKWSGV
ncbi:hypothetical protein S7711_07207 [Stachybotrys chartarum IBT 7711]|uniref:Nucleolar 27S pre-rRNA processing Urb2/Npa2 C-terminal domain-containing protein n=1 Tax=Stachybotrys chartarum (strain CBS 109288 / IBT 7711) TaxID=1280523 RepID=A0A084AKJ7_STACB|nr:hypothetical protein S7711_07207 [Stachybotrys chartarum IBT 7711]